MTFERGLEARLELFTIRLANAVARAITARESFG